jgi:hypothetical protein
MTEKHVRSETILRCGVFRSCLMLCGCAALLASGCSMRKRPAIPWATAIQVKPAVPARAAGLKDVPEDQIPDLHIEIANFPSRLLTSHSAPPRPRINAPANSGGGSDEEASGAPRIVPQLTAEETASAQQQTNQSLNIAEKNLESARGKQLSAAQVDLVSKIKGFLKDAREAAQGADWTRARSLSKKAEVLSQELVAAR